MTSRSVCFPQLLVTACPVLYIKQVFLYIKQGGGCVYMNLLHILYSSLKHLRHRQKQVMGWYRAWVWFIPAVVGIFVFVFAPCPVFCLFLPLDCYMWISILLFCCAYTDVDEILLCHFILYATLRAVQSRFWCIFLCSLNEWENTEVGKLNVCGCMHPWNRWGPWDLYCLPPEIVRPGFLMSAMRNALL